MAKPTVAIVGLGVIGSSLGLALKKAGGNFEIVGHDREPSVSGKARKIEAVDKTSWNLINAVEGADLVVDPAQPDALAMVMEATRGIGVDCALDCAGSVPAERLCIDATRRKGKVAYVGECGDELPIRVSPDMIRKGLTIIGSWHYNLSLFSQIMQVIQKSPVIDLLVSHVLPMSRIQEAFELCASHQCAKVILKPWE